MRACVWVCGVGGSDGGNDGGVSGSVGRVSGGGGDSGIGSRST